MKYPLVALGLLVAGVSAAQAQSVISRQITEEPVETIVTQGPYGTVVTRRPLYDAPVATQPLAPAGTVMVRPYGLTPPASIPIVAEGADEDEPVVTTVRPRVSARPAPVRQVRAAPVRSAKATRTVRRVGAPLDLTPAQSRTIYRTIVERRVYEPRTIAVAPQVYEGAYAAYPGPAYDPLVTYAPAYAYQAPAMTYAVGAPLPASVAVAPLPEPVSAQIPLTRGYRYAVIGGRVLLIDPATGVVVADVTQ